MEKKPKTEVQKDEKSTKVVNQQVERLDDMDDMDDMEDNEPNNEPNETVASKSEQSVVVKKSSGGLSLVLSLVSLAAVGYLFYQHWQANKQSNNQVTSPAVIQQLQDSDQVLSTDLKNAQVDINRVKQQTAQITVVEQQLKQLNEQFNDFKNSQQQISSVGTESQFDNSQNELALADIQLKLTDQARIIAELQATPLITAVPQATPEDLRSDSYQQIEKNAATQVLLTADVLLSTHRLPQAIAALDNYLKVSSLKPVDKNNLQRLLGQMQQIDVPDLALIDQQLQALQTSVNDLQVSTQQAASDEPKWYERFVSVQKIETDSSISSTAQLIAFKTELNRLLYQAKLYLMLSDQVGWQSSLSAVSQWVKQEMPEHNELSNRIMSLADQTVVAVIPSEVNIASVIDAMNGLR